MCDLLVNTRHWRVKGILFEKYLTHHEKDQKTRIKNYKNFLQDLGGNLEGRGYNLLVNT